MHIEVLTPRYASSWPEELVVREIPVHRPAAAPRSDWSIGRYLKHLTSWLQQHAQSFDALLVDAIREEAIAVTEVGKQLGIPVVLRCSGWGDASDPNWWKTSRTAKRCCNVAKNADAIVADGGINQRDLIAEGFAPERIQRINKGFPNFPARTALSRQLAREALGKVNSDLITHEQTPVLLCTSPMTRGGGINLLVNAAPHLINRYRDLRLWFIGDGPTVTGFTKRYAVMAYARRLQCRVLFRISLSSAKPRIYFSNLMMMVWTIFYPLRSQLNYR